MKGLQNGPEFTIAWSLQAVKNWNNETNRMEEKEWNDLKLKFPRLIYYLNFFILESVTLAHLYFLLPKSDTLSFFYLSIWKLCFVCPDWPVILFIVFFSPLLLGLAWLGPFESSFLLCQHDPVSWKTHFLTA